MQILFMCLVVAAGYGFSQANEWSFVTTVFAMAGLLCIPLALTEILLHPFTRMRFSKDQRFIIGFLVAQSVLAFAVLQSPKALQGADTEIARYAAIWWLIIPHCCIVLVILDRVFNAFGGKDMIELRPETPPQTPEQPSAAPNDNLINFDPKRFK